MTRELHCAYCGRQASTRDHVVPRALYPDSKANSRVQRITVPACPACNKSWADDEAHFRNILLMAGEPNEPVNELWNEKALRSFTKKDGHKRKADVIAQLIRTQTREGPRHMLYPGRDERVMRIVRKIIRGMCYHHRLIWPVTDRQVWADVMCFQVPADFLTAMTSAHAERDIIEYRYEVMAEDDLHSWWLLTFYKRTTFIGRVFQSEEARAHMDARSENTTAHS